MAIDNNEIALRRVLYWPGIRRDPCELSGMWQTFSKQGIEKVVMSVPYDEGDTPGSNSLLVDFLDSIDSCDWWIGLSIGGLVAHVVSSGLTKEHLPRRITFINPVADRKMLAERNGFSLENKWHLELRKLAFACPHVVEFVVSINDSRVPNSHASQMAKRYPDDFVRWFYIESDHSISSVAMQEKLAYELLRSEG